jgi:hypothetical protein
MIRATRLLNQRIREVIAARQRATGYHPRMEDIEQPLFMFIRRGGVIVPRVPMRPEVPADAPADAPTNTPGGKSEDTAPVPGDRPGGGPDGKTSTVHPRIV